MTLRLLVAAALSVSAGLAQASDWPAKPIRLVIGFAPGGLTDINGRVFASALQKKFGQPVVVENRPGAGGAIGREAVSKSAPDGYTLLTEPTTILGYAVFTKNPTFDVQKDLAPVSILTEGAFVVVASAASPFKTWQEMIDYAKANPGKLNYSSNGPGVVTLSLEAIKAQYGLTIQGIDYKSSADAYRSLVQNETQLTLTSVGRAATDTAAGRVRSLAVTGEARQPLMPNVPTGKELKFDRLFASWQGLFAPPKTPQPIVKALYDAVVEVSKTKEVTDALAKMEQDVVASTPEGLAQRMDRDIKAWRDVVKVAGIKVE